MKLSISRIFFLVLCVLFSHNFANAVGPSITKPTIAQNVEISPAQKTGSFIEGALFEVPIYINTQGQNINTIKLSIGFDPKKISVVDASGGTSIISLWLESPTFNNTNGTEKMTGVITNGITTDYGVIATITFRALSPGDANLTIKDDSLVLLNDGFGSEAKIQAVRGQYTILPKPPGGVKIYSQTHSVQDHWYNSSSPVFSWDKDPGVTGFSYVLDDKPNTVPGNTVISQDNIFGYQDIKDGIWYFHLKAQKKGFWGEATHFQIKIDTKPPESFKPTVNYLKSGDTRKAFIAFDTKDKLSGIDHYEVNTIDISKSEDEDAPIFIETQSPYLMSLLPNQNIQVVVRAFDKAGNASDNYVTIKDEFLILHFLRTNIIYVLVIILLILISLILVHYFVTHKVISHIKHVYQILRNTKEE